MAGHMAVIETGNILVKLLRGCMVPEFIKTESEIGLCSPGEREEETIGIYLYDIRENEDVGVRGMIPDGIHSQRHPSAYYDLYYMITVYSSGGLKFRNAQEHRIIGRILQLFLDTPSIRIPFLSKSSKKQEELVRIEYSRLTVDEKMKIFNMPNQSYKLSMFYRVYPVEIKSDRVKKIQRVLDLAITVQEPESGNGGKE